MRRKSKITILVIAVIIMAIIYNIDVGKAVASNTATTDANGKYIITDEKNMTAQYTGVSKKSVTSVSIPATVTINGQLYNVTSIKANALNGNTKIKKLTISSNVKTIGKKAFYNCKNLKTVTIKTTKLTSSSVKASAFKGLNSKITVTVPKEKLASYKKILKAKGLTGKKQTVKGKKMAVEEDNNTDVQPEPTLNPNREIPEPEVRFGIGKPVVWKNPEDGNTKKGEYVTNDVTKITVGFQMSDLVYGEWTTRTTDGGFWIRCHCDKGHMFDNFDDYNIFNGFPIDGCSDGGYVTGNDYGEPFTAWHWIYDNNPCSAAIKISLPEGLSYKNGTLKMYRMVKKLVDSSAYQVTTSGQDIIVFIEDIKNPLLHAGNLADDISVSLDVCINSSIVSTNTISAEVSYNNGNGEKVVNPEDITIYNRGKGYDLYFYLKDSSGNKIDNAEFILYPRNPSDEVAAEGKHAISGSGSIITPGYYHVHGVPSGDYDLVMVGSPSGYKNMPALGITITEDGKITSPGGNPLVSQGGATWTKMVGKDGFKSTIILENE